MDTSEIIDKFESKDAHLIWEATWEILRCNDVDQLILLRPHIGQFKKILSQVEMGGALRRNEDDTKLAFSYIEGRCNGRCRCKLYSGHNFFNPEKESKYGFVSIDSSKIMKELYEQHFEVSCSHCKNKFKVREVHGWHVPWYDWSKA